MKTAHYWLSEANQAVPVVNGWWVAPFVEIEAMQYPDDCRQAITLPVAQAILDVELDWACAADPLPIFIS